VAANAKRLDSIEAKLAQVGISVPPVESGPPTTHVVDATEWRGDATREREALIGLMTAIVHALGHGAMDAIDNCGLQHHESGLGPVAFATAVLGPATPGDERRGWSN
jgi:hypothetical protein